LYTLYFEWITLYPFGTKLFDTLEKFKVNLMPYSPNLNNFVRFYKKHQILDTLYFEWITLYPFGIFLTSWKNSKLTPNSLNFGNVDFFNKIAHFGHPVFSVDHPVSISKQIF